MRLLGGLGEIALAHLAVEVASFLLHAVQKGIEAAGGDGLVDVEHDGEIRPVGADGDASDGDDVVSRHATGGALVGEGGADEAVGEDELVPGESGADDLLDELGPAGHVEHHLAGDAHVVVGGVEEDAADLFADGSAAWFADLADGKAGAAEAVGQANELG